MNFTPGSLVFYDDSDGGALHVQPLADQRAVMADIPEGATRVVVVAPVFVPRLARLRKRLSGLPGGLRIPSR